MTYIVKQFIQHPREVPLEYSISDAPAHYNPEADEQLDHSGLSFQCDDYIEPQQWLHLYIPINNSHFETDALVRWCELDENTGVDNVKPRYNVGVSFGDRETAFSARMVEQVCHIEEYRKNVQKEEGRELSNDQAAQEWIARYAEQFPPLAG